MAKLRFAPAWVGLAAGIGALAVAHLVQEAGLVPCALCYLERWPYRVAIVLALAGLAWPAGRRPITGLLVLTFLVAAGLGMLHAGVEWGFWKSPLPECAAPVLRMGSIKDMLASMPSHISKPCDDPTYLVPGLPVSMAQMNALYGLAAAALVAICGRWRSA